MADMFIKQEDGTWTGLKVEISVALDSKGWTLYEPPGYLAALAQLDEDVAEVIRLRHERIKARC